MFPAVREIQVFRCRFDVRDFHIFLWNHTVEVDDEISAFQMIPRQIRHAATAVLVGIVAVDYQTKLIAR